MKFTETRERMLLPNKYYRGVIVRRIVMKVINLFTIVCLLICLTSVGRSQTRGVYQADLLISEGKTVKTRRVEISLEDEALILSNKKKSKTETTARRIPLTAIESVEYSYSERPRYTAATLSTIALGIVALPLFASRTKKNWLTINAAADSAILQLQSDNYRMLLLEMQKRKIKIADTGDRDANEKKAKESEKQ